MPHENSWSHELGEAADQANFFQRGRQFCSAEVEHMVRWLPEPCSSAQEVSAHLYLSNLQNLGREAPQAQPLAVTGGEFADPSSKDLGIVCQSHQCGETHFAGKEGGNTGA